jgi:DNA-binding Lrp family transcriptional regulator
MRISTKRIRNLQRLLEEKYIWKEKFIIAAILLVILPFAALGQINSNKTTSNNPNKSKKNWLSEKALVIENISIIDGVNPAVQPNRTIVIVGNRIKALGVKGEVSIPAKAKIINGKGKYLIPGLWDSHVHLSDKKVFLPLFVANGVTSVREMGGDLQELKQMREQIANGQLLGPRIKTAGTIIESEKWMKWVLDITKKDGDTESYERLSKRIGISSPEHAKEVIKKLAESGVDLIKIRNSASPETFLAIEAEAKKYGLPVAAHAPRMDLALASAGGLKSIEHTDSTSGAMQNQDLKTVAKAFAQNGTWYTPTLITGIIWRLTPKETLSKLLNDDQGKIDERNLYVPTAIRQTWKRQLESQKMSALSIMPEKPAKE